MYKTLKDFGKKLSIIAAIAIPLAIGVGCYEKGNTSRPYEEIKQEATEAVEAKLNLFQEHLDYCLIDQQLSNRQAETLDEEVEDIYATPESKGRDLLPEDAKMLEKRIKKSFAGQFEATFSDTNKGAEDLEKLLEEKYGKNIEVYGLTDGGELILGLLTIFAGLAVLGLIGVLGPLIYRDDKRVDEMLRGY